MSGHFLDDQSNHAAHGIYQRDILYFKRYPTVV